MSFDISQQYHLIGKYINFGSISMKYGNIEHRYICAKSVSELLFGIQCSPDDAKFADRALILEACFTEEFKLEGKGTILIFLAYNLCSTTSFFHVSHLCM